MKQLCINFDWFEVYTHESAVQPADADFFRGLGFVVLDRAYGTRVYAEMFTLVAPDGHPWLEVRRRPLSSVMHPRSIHFRLVNRSCYEPDGVQTLFRFLSDLGFSIEGRQVCSVSRVDVAFDFREFDTMPVPVFLRNYLTGVYAKIGQSRFCSFGRDLYSDKVYHAIKWGSPSSMVSTKLYNKTLEMSEEKLKPWIIQQWVACGLLADSYDESTIWRLEFSISTDCSKWVVESNGIETYYLNNDIEFWCNRKNLQCILAGLVRHYFRFVVIDEKVNKYRAPRVSLFDFKDTECYRPVALSISRSSGRTEKLIVKRLDALLEEPLLERFSQSIQNVKAIMQVLFRNRVAESVEDESAVIQKMMNDEDFRSLDRFLNDQQGNHSLPLDTRMFLDDIREQLAIQYYGAHSGERIPTMGRTPE